MEIKDLAKIIKETLVETRSNEFGQYGFDVISDTNAHTGTWYCIQAPGNADAVISATVSSLGDALSSFTLASGTSVYGPFTSITLTSGTVLAYRKNNLG